jgi:GNAT superfamily N-acetyltransferase
VEPELNIRHSLAPRDVDAIVEMHRALYAAEQGWSDEFGDYVRAPLERFRANHTERECIWLVESGAALVGSIAIVDAGGNTAQLRWLLVHPEYRGKGIGKALVLAAIDFSRACSYETIILWTVSALREAANLYRALGFALVEEKPSRIWGADLTEQRYELLLGRDL